MAQKYEYDEKTNSYIPVDEKRTKNFYEDNKLISLILWAIQLANVTGFPIVVTLVAYFYYKDNNEYLYNTAKEVLNYLISLLVYGVVGTILSIPLGILTFGILPIIIFLGLGAYAIVIPILGILKASDNQVYKPALTIRFIK